MSTNAAKCDLSAGITGHLKRRNSNEKRTHPDHDLPVAYHRHPGCPDNSEPTVDEGQYPVLFRPLPAGEYTIYTLTPERSVRIVSADGKHSAIVNTLPNYASSPSSNSRLVFHKYGNEYFLAQVWTAGQNVARNPLSSKRAMEIAGSGGKPEMKVVIALADVR